MKKNNILALSIKLKNHNIKRALFQIKEAIIGTERDFTQGSMWKAIILLSIPMVLEMVFESIFAIADIYFVSRLGADAIATVGITESLITIVYAVGIGLSMATTAIISRRTGEKDSKGASVAAFQAIIIGVVISSLIAIPGAIFASDILSLMGANNTISGEMASYTAIMLGGNGIIMLLFIINGIFRSAGDAAISMRILLIANLLNIILDPCLIFGLGPFPELGIKGAAIATNVGRGIAVICQFYLLFNGSRRVKLAIQDFKTDFKVMKQLLKLSLGTIGQFIIATSSWIGLTVILAKFGSEVLAGYTIAIRVIIFSLLPSFGISNAAGTLVGQNLGAKQPDRAEKSVWATAKINVIFLSSIAAIFIIFPEFFIQVFTDEQRVISAGVNCLRIMSYGFVFYGLGMVLINSFNGAGDTFTPTKINLICFWMIEIPLAYFLAISLGMEEEGVFYSIIIAETLLTIISVIIFKRGKWKLKEV